MKLTIIAKIRETHMFLQPTHSECVLLVLNTFQCKLCIAFQGTMSFSPVGKIEDLVWKLNGVEGI